jgi:hypothetical protein
MEIQVIRHIVTTLPGCAMVILECATDLYHMLGEACHLSHMDPKALVTYAWFHFIQQRE